MRLLSATAIALAALLASRVAPAVGEGGRSSAEVAACVERNVPEPDNVRAVRITARDPRAGSKRVIVLKMYGRRSPEGLRQLLVRFSEPDEVVGVSLLVLEQAGPADVYLASPELPEPRKITMTDRSSAILGTDLSYEDLEWLQGFRTPRDATRLPDEEVGERDCYVLESALEGSSYSRVLAFIDKESCLPLRLRFFEKSGRLRKEVTADPLSLVRHGDTWVAHAVLIRDARDLTTTHFVVDTHEQDVLLPDGMFDVEGLRRSLRGAGSPTTAPAEP